LLPQQTDAAGGDAYLQSFARGLAVLVAFTPGQERLTIAQVAKATRLTRAGARRILLTLEHLGYVASDKRLFFLTSQVLHLVAGYSAQPVWETTRKVLKSVAEKLNETVSAGILDGTEVVYTVRIRSAHLLHLDLKEGARLPAHASSMGRVLLAALPPGSLERYLRTAELRRYTAATVTDPDILRKRVDEVRKQGWCAVHGEIEDGHSGVSVPLADASGKTIAALNVGLRSGHASPQIIGKTIVPVLREAARSIAASL
jgi:IclR family pca regulon transcriptional regulator